MSLRLHAHSGSFNSSLRKALLGGTCLLYGVCAAAGAQAAGFALKEQSASAQGNSFAGATAGAEDITYMFFNPAGLTRHDGIQAAAVVSYISPSAKTNDAASVLGGEASQEAGESAIVPAFYGLWSISPDLKLGLGINTPYGLRTEYSQTWAGRFHAVESELLTINVNPAVAYRINQWLSIGAGIQAQYMDVTLSNIIDGDFNPGNGIQEALAELEGDDWHYGYNFGVMIDFSPSTRLGLGYRSRISHTAEGTLSVNGAFVDNVTADFTSPDSATVGIYHEINANWAVMAEAGWTGWTVFDEIRVRFQNTPLPDAVTPENWDDAWFGAVGATWRPTPQWTVRAGVAYDQSPVPDEFRTPRIPDEDRTWASIGARFEVSPSLAIDAGYTHIFVKDSTVDLTDPVPLTATYENSVDILTAQVAIKF